MKRVRLEHFQGSVDTKRWDRQNLGGVMDVLDEFEYIAFEIKNCTRGSHAGIGDSSDDMMIELYKLHYNLGVALKQIEKHLD